MAELEHGRLGPTHIRFEVQNADVRVAYYTARMGTGSRIQQQKSLIVKLLGFHTPNASQRQLPRYADQAGVRRAPVGAVANSFTSTLSALKQFLPMPRPTLNQSHSKVVKASRHS
jgi:hypothetical protein